MGARRGPGRNRETLIGASANVVIAQAAQKHKYFMSFRDFAAYGLPIVLLSTILVLSVFISVTFVKNNGLHEILTGGEKCVVSR